MNFVKIAIVALFTLLLSIGSTAMAGPADGTYKMRADLGSSSVNFNAIVSKGKLQLSGKKSLGLKVELYSVQGTTHKLQVSHRHNRCPQRVKSEWHFDMSGATPIMIRNDGKCGSSGSWDRKQRNVGIVAN